MNILELHPEEVEKFMRGEELRVDNSPLMMALYTYYIDSGEMPIGIAKARTGDPDFWLMAKMDEYLNPSD